MNKNIVGLGDVYENRIARDELFERQIERENIDCADCGFADDCQKQCRRKFYV
jgi:radical SAM protein with 4Fe4S-binding SPASM domain